MLSKITPSTLYPTLATVSKPGNEFCSLRIWFVVGDNFFFMQGFLLAQFPVRVCFRKATNRTQDQSFNGDPGFDLRKNLTFFEQMYVVLLRSTHP